MTKALRILHILLAVCGVALLITLVVVLSIPTDTKVIDARFERAQLCTEAAKSMSYDRTGLRALLASDPPRDCPETVALPYRSPGDGVKLLRENVRPMRLAWYEVRYDVPSAWNEGDELMIYSARVLGLGWQLRVNGQTITDNLADWRMTWNRPIAVSLTSAHFRAGDRVKVELGIAFDPQVGHGLARISVGPASALAQRVAIRQFLQFVMPVACSVTLLAMSAFFLLFWWSRRMERTHLYLALSCIAWCICNLQYVLPRREDARLDAWYSAVAGPAITWVMWLLYLFVLQLDNRFSRIIPAAMPPFVLLMTVIALPIVPLSDNVGLFYQGANVAVAALIAIRIGWMAARGGSIELRVISLALVVAILAGAHDLALLAQRINPESVFLLPYSSMLIFGSLLFAVQRRYVKAIVNHEQLSRSLSRQLSEREAELQVNHSRLLELERAQTLATERQRLMHDMHDGLGSALTTSLAMIEQGNVDEEQLKQVLRDSVDDLRAVIDSLEPLEGDLVSVLATLRFRLGRRLELAGIALEWDMHDLPALPWLGPPQALQLIRIVQEVLTNVVKHAAAKHLRISAQCSEPYIEVCIADDGRGFDVTTTSTGRGLRHLRQRAAGLHGSVLIDSQRGLGTTVRLLLPISTDRSAIKRDD